MVADFGKAAGIAKARRDQMRSEEIRVRTSEMYKQMQAAQMANMNKTSASPISWTDSNADYLEEIDAGFDNRVVVLRPGYKYTHAQAPTIGKWD
jgi:hypothetical protein